jgi:hypothetical protein
MSKSDTTFPAQKVTKDEIVAAIDEICSKKGQPVVRLDDLVEVDSITVGKQAIKNHLEELVEMGRVEHLSYGQAGVWWLPEETTTDVEIEAGVINWDNIAAEEIPSEVLNDLPQFQDQTYWENASDTWGTVAVGALFLMFTSALLEIFRQDFPGLFPSESRAVLSIIIVGGLSVTLLSFLLIYMMKLAQVADDAGLFDPVRDVSARLRGWIVRHLRNIFTKGSKWLSDDE